MSERIKKILVVDDEADIRRFLRASLRLYYHEIIEASTGENAIDQVFSQKPDLLILDLGLPDIDGVDVTRQVRSFNSLPIIILSVRNSEKDKIEALDAGADDYLTKPFSIGELLARVRVVSRRLDPQVAEPVLQVYDLVLDIPRHRLTKAQEEISLTPTEFDILALLMQSRGVVVTHGQIIRKVWGSVEQDSSLLRVNISNLRHKLEKDPNQPDYIQTELGVGYRFIQEIE